MASGSVSSATIHTRRSELPVTATCPTWPTLLAWIENDLPEEEAQLLNTHVVDSDECREKLALINAVQDVGQ